MKNEMNKTKIKRRITSLEKLFQHHYRIEVQLELIEYTKHCEQRKFRTHV